MAKTTMEKLHSRKLSKVIVLQKDFEQCTFAHAKLFEKVQERDLELKEISADKECSSSFYCYFDDCWWTPFTGHSGD